MQSTYLCGSYKEECARCHDAQLSLFVELARTARFSEQQMRQSQVRSVVHGDRKQLCRFVIRNGAHSELLVSDHSLLPRCELYCFQQLAGQAEAEAEAGALRLAHQKVAEDLASSIEQLVPARLSTLK